MQITNAFVGERSEVKSDLGQCSATFFICGASNANCDSYWHTDNIYYKHFMILYCDNNLRKKLVIYCISPFTYITYMQSKNMRILYINTATEF
jgi:hypothetical protein